jgi:fatty acid desaturase
MKQYPREQELLSLYLNGRTIPGFSPEQWKVIQTRVKHLREEAEASPRFHALMEALPFLILIVAWIFLIFVLPGLIASAPLLFVLLFIAHGTLGYQWVIYGIHEGAGHGLFRRGNSRITRLLRFLAFHSSRLMMADPVHYHEQHKSHHRFTGTEQDGSQTNFVLGRRVLLSLLPGAGILFPNDYRVHHGEGFSRSLAISGIIGFARVMIEVRALSLRFSLTECLVLLLLLSPWVGLALDRIRESLEHHLMPRSPTYGTRELGFSPLSLWITGGPWGQPCHLAHHLAPELNWYQQIRLHSALEQEILNEEQLAFFGFQTPILRLIRDQIRKHFSLEFPKERSQA